MTLPFQELDALLRGHDDLKILVISSFGPLPRRRFQE